MFVPDACHSITPMNLESIDTHNIPNDFNGFNGLIDSMFDYIKHKEIKTISYKEPRNAKKVSDHVYEVGDYLVVVFDTILKLSAKEVSLLDRTEGTLCLRFPSVITIGTYLKQEEGSLDYKEDNFVVNEYLLSSIEYSFIEFAVTHAKSLDQTLRDLSYKIKNEENLHNITDPYTSMIMSDFINTFKYEVGDFSHSRLNNELLSYSKGFKFSRSYIIESVSTVPKSSELFSNTSGVYAIYQFNMCKHIPEGESIKFKVNVVIMAAYQNDGVYFYVDKGQVNCRTPLRDNYGERVIKMGSYSWLKSLNDIIRLSAYRSLRDNIINYLRKHEGDFIRVHRRNNG